MRLTGVWLTTALVALWWVAKSSSIFASTCALIGVCPTLGSSGGDAAFKELRWLDLTVVQHLLAVTVSLIWLKAITRQKIWPEDVHKKTIYVAAFGHVVGSLAVNAAYSVNHFGVLGNVTLASQPVVTYLLSSVYYSDHQSPSVPALILTVSMIITASAVMVTNVYVVVHTLLAFICASLAFPLRNVFLKRLSDSWESAVQKYAAISICSTLILLPLLCIKFVATRTFFTLSFRGSFVISVISYVTYNIASLSVLQEVSPLFHAVLNLPNRVLFYMVYSLYTSLSTASVLVFILFVVSFILFLTQSNLSQKILKWTSVFLILVSCFSISRKFLSAPHVTKVSFDKPPLPVPFSKGLSLIKLTTMTETLSNADTVIRTAWTYARPIPPDVAANIQTLLSHAPGTSVRVYCGSSQCVQTVMDLNNENVTAEFLVVTDIVKDTPLEKWMVRHPLYKVLAGVEYEDHLQEAAKLGILWHYGGTYVEPTLKPKKELKFPSEDHAWINKMDSESDSPRTLDALFLPVKHHPIVGMLAEQFVSEYSKTNHFNFQDVVHNTVVGFCREDNDNCPTYVTLEFEKLEKTADIHHFGTFLPNNTSPTIELEREIQDLSEIQFLPFVDHILNLKKISGNDQITTFFSGWLGGQDIGWPPADNIHPVMLSLHIEPMFKGISDGGINYLRKAVPIGCRDKNTLTLLRAHNVESYFSGSMALLMKNPNVNGSRTDSIYLVNVSSEIQKLLPQDIQDKATSLDSVKESNEKRSRLTETYNHIEMYASAKVVITQSIHCAMVCVAMGTPVIFINSTKSNDDQLMSLFHTIHLHNSAPEETKRWLHEFPWDNPPPNPNIATMMRLRATLWNVIRNNRQLYDASYKFGIVPFSPPPTESTADKQLLFHFLFTTSKKSTVAVFDKGGGNVHGAFNWRHMRTVESVFYHHPLAKVIVHSNTLDQSEFDMLTEAGYDIKVQRYNLLEWLKGTPAEKFASKLESAQNGGSWYSHETDLLRILVLWKWGGVYMDTDMIVVRPLNMLQENVLGWQEQNYMNGAFMKFEKGNPFIQACLKEFAEHYGYGWADNGPLLLSRVWKKSFKGSNDVHVLKVTAFYMFFWADVKSRCFHESDKNKVNKYMTVLKEEAYAVHLNSKITVKEGTDTNKLIEGTVCKYLLNSFCVLCDKQH